MLIGGNSQKESRYLHSPVYCCRFRWRQKLNLNILHFSARCKQTFSPPPVVAYKRTPNLRDLLVRTQLRDNTNPQQKSPPGIYKCNYPRCLTCPFLQDVQAKYSFSATKEERCINDSLSCKSKKIIYLIECRKCTKQYIGETKRQLQEHFGEHRRSNQNHHQLIKPTPVSTHFNQPCHLIDHLLLTPLELIHSKRDSVRKAREAHLINKAMTLEPLGINRRDEQN